MGTGHFEGIGFIHDNVRDIDEDFRLGREYLNKAKIVGTKIVFLLENNLAVEV